MNKSENSVTVMQANIQSSFSLSQSSISPINSKIHQKPPPEAPINTKGSVKSYCRIRPNNTLYSSLDRFTLENNNKTLIVDFTADQDKSNPSKQYKYKYNFTEIFLESNNHIIDNKEIYEKVCKQSVQELFSMHKNALIFVYGITNSGKTYTINGNMKKPGILQYSLIALFNEYQKLKENNNSWNLTCTYIEIYNEEVFDLLSKDRKKIKIVGGGNKFYCQGCNIKTINKKEDFSAALTTGELNRTKSETNSNPYSSRSHSIFRVELSYEDKEGFSFIEPVSLCIVDLAGAERVSKSGVIGTGLKEAGNINSSLLVLKKCFDAMESNSRTNLVEKKIIVPVRESKLTMIFKEYFAAHQNISVICTINPDKNEMMDIRSVLNFGAKAMKVKPVKSWIPVYNNYNSKIGSRDNSPLVKDNKKKYRLLTEKKYLEKSNNLSKNASKENIYKVKEDIYSSNNSSNSNSGNEIYSKKKEGNGYNILNSNDKLQNIKLLSSQKKYIHEKYISPNKFKDNHVLTLHNVNSGIKHESKESKEKITKENYDQRIKCFSNPYDMVTIKENNFFVKNFPSKSELQLEKELKEKKNNEIKEKISKHKEDIKNMFYDLFIKKLYYKNLEHNINIYEKQCNNIDLNEVEILLKNNNDNNFFSLKNPFIKSIEEKNKKILSKTHQIDISYLTVLKKNLLKNENNINISFKPLKKNEAQNYQIFNNYNIGYFPDKDKEKENKKNNEFDVFRGNKEFIEELQIKLNNSEHDQSKILEFLDKSFEQYNASQFKAYFGIGNSLIKRVNENNDINNKVNILNNKNNDINIVDKIDKAENDTNINFNMDNIFINDLFNNDDNEYNFKKKGKNNNIIKESSKESNKYNHIQTIKLNKKEERELKSSIDSKNDIEMFSLKDEKDKGDDKDDDKDKDISLCDKEKEKINNKNKKEKEKRNKSRTQNIKKRDRKKKKYEDYSEKEDEKEKEKEDNNNSGTEHEEKKEESYNRDENDDKDSNEEKIEIELKKGNKRKKEKKSKSKSKPKSKKGKSKKNKKKYDIDDNFSNEEKEPSINSNNDNSNEEQEKEIVISKNKKKGKNKKKKIEFDIDSSDDISEENENIKVTKIRKKRKGKSKKRY